MDREEIRALIIEHVEAEDACDMDRVMKTYCDEAVFEDVPSGRLYEGKDAIAILYQERFDGFPSMHRRIDRLFIDENVGIVEITMIGPHEGYYQGLPPDGRMSNLRIIGRFDIDVERKLVLRETAYYDLNSVMVQLGLLPDLTRLPGRIWLALTRPSILWRVTVGRLRNPPKPR